MKLCVECNIHFSEDLDSCPNDGTQLIVVGDDPLIGKLIGDKYRILSHAGKGSMAIVYRAIQESTGREMAVKMLHQFLGAKEESVKRFIREAKAVSSLHHTNIVKLYDFGVMPDGQPYIVTEFLDGITLTEVLRQRQFMTVKEALPLFEQVCAGMAESHRNNVIHRDLKPDNIVCQLVDLDAPKDSPDMIVRNSVRVVDFGVAKMWSETGGSSASLTLEGKVCGSPAYMSPEQCKGSDIDYRSDIYSLGVVIFETLTGQRPFSANDLMALMLMHVNKEAPSIGAVMPDVTFPPALSAVVLKALSKDPKDRQQTVEELWEEIDSVCRGRRSRPVAEDTPVDDWIPFDANAQVLQPSTVVRRPELSPMSALSSDASWSQTTTEMSNVKTKKKKKIFRFGWSQMQTGLFVGVVVVSVLSLLKMSVSVADAATARKLMDAGNFEGSIQVFEALKSKGQLSKENMELLNESYYRLAQDKLSANDTDNAIWLLESIDNNSKRKKEAKELLKKTKAKLKKSADPFFDRVELRG